MKNNIGQITVEFNKAAVKVFTFLFNRYEHNTVIFRQKKDEKVVLHLNNQYVVTLKQQLNEAALSILDKYKIAAGNIIQVQKLLAEQINFYLKEFSHKSGVMIS